MHINAPEWKNANKLSSVLQTSSTRIPGTVIPPPLVRGGQQTSSKLGTQQNTQIVMPPLVRGAQVFALWWIYSVFLECVLPIFLVILLVWRALVKFLLEFLDTVGDPAAERSYIVVAHAFVLSHNALSEPWENPVVMWDAAFTCRASDSFFPRLHQRIVCAFIVKADLGASSFTWHLGEQRKLNTVPYSCFFFFF